MKDWGWRIAALLLVVLVVIALQSDEGDALERSVTVYVPSFDPVDSLTKPSLKEFRADEEYEDDPQEFIEGYRFGSSGNLWRYPLDTKLKELLRGAAWTPLTVGQILRGLTDEQYPEKTLKALRQYKVEIHSKDHYKAWNDLFFLVRHSDVTDVDITGEYWFELQSNFAGPYVATPHRFLEDPGTQFVYPDLTLPSGAEIKGREVLFSDQSGMRIWEELPSQTKGSPSPDGSGSVIDWHQNALVKAKKVQLGEQYPLPPDTQAYELLPEDKQ